MFFKLYSVYSNFLKFMQDSFVYCFSLKKYKEEKIK